MCTREQIISWIRGFGVPTSGIMVENYCYNCVITGDPKTKTVIVLPNDLEDKGVITIDKPLEEVMLTDVIELYSRIR